MWASKSLFVYHYFRLCYSYLYTDLILKTVQTRLKKHSNAFNSLSVLERLFKNVYNGLSVLGEFVRTCVFLFLSPLMTPFVCIHVLEIFPVSCLLDDSILSQDVVLPRDDSVCFETYLL